MSNTVLGTKMEYTFYMDFHRVETDDGKWDYVDGELVDEESIVGWRGTCPEASQSTTVQIGFYYKPPDSEWYWDYEYGIPYKPIVPVVFSIDSNDNLIECLNQNFTEVSLEELDEGWIVMNVTLKRRLVQNENISFGVYSDLVGITGMDFADLDYQDMDYYYFSNARRSDYDSAIAYVSSQAFITQSRKLETNYFPIIYLEYVNGENVFAYTRTVIGTVGIVATTNRKAFLKIGKTEAVSVVALISKLLAMARNCLSEFVYSEIMNHKADYRKLETELVTKTDSKSHKVDYKKLETELVTETDLKSHKADYKKTCNDTSGNTATALRKTFNVRSYADEFNVDSIHFVSRLLVRAVQTVSGLWDWIRVKIREANNVVTLFCPIDLEIEMECRI